MIVKITKWVETGRDICTGNFTWGEMVKEKTILDTDLVEVFNAKKVRNVYGFPYDVVRIPYKKFGEYPFLTDSESYSRLLNAMNREIVEI